MPRRMRGNPRFTDCELLLTFDLVAVPRACRATLIFASGAATNAQKAKLEINDALSPQEALAALVAPPCSSNRGTAGVKCENYLVISTL